jgi:hypothetical protein
LPHGFGCESWLFVVLPEGIDLRFALPFEDAEGKAENPPLQARFATSRLAAKHPYAMHH